MPFVLFLLGAAAVALVASQSKTSPKGGGGRTYKLDANLPPQLRDQVLAALATQKDPATLLAFAAALSPNYPLAAAALSQRAAELGGAPAPLPQPNPLPTPKPTPTPGPSQNPMDLLAQIPDPPRTQVVTMLMQSNDPNALEAYAGQMDAQGFPIAAQALRLKEQLLRSQGINPTPTPAPVPNPGPMPPPGVLPAPLPQPAPQPQPGPAPSPFSLDPGMPPQMQSAVLGALTTEQDPVKLAVFAQEIQGQYPIAAGLLMAKANALRLQPGPLPMPSFPPQPGPQPSPSVVPTTPPGALPIGDDSTRTCRNAGRPSGYPFIHLHGESTYPAKISKQATGSEMNYPQMSAINPQFAADGVHWKNIQTGDALNIPWAWVSKLAALYRIEVDPGTQPPVTASSPSTAIALSPQALLARKGTTNGAAASHA